MELIFKNNAHVLSSYYKTHGEIRPDAFQEMKTAPAPAADSYDGLMQTVGLLSQSPDNRFPFRPEQDRHMLKVSPPGSQSLNEDSVLAVYSGDSGHGELRLTDELGILDSPERRVELNDVFYRGDNVIAFSQLQRGQGGDVIVDMLDRKDPSRSTRYILPADSQWLSGSCDLGEVSFPAKQ